MEVVERLKQFKETKNAFTTLGRYDVVVDVEASDFRSIGEVVLRMGKVGGVVLTETLVEVERRK